MKVIKVTPRGYCYGVVDALQLARTVSRDPAAPRPIYILGQIVHNRHAVQGLTDEGIITLDGPDRLAMLEQVEAGTVIFTAHGVSPAVKEAARRKGLRCVDATCPDVTRTHDLVIRLVADGYTVVYIGKRGHPEPEGVMGEAPDHVLLVETLADVDALALSTDKLAVTNQTTLSQWDTQEMIDRLRARYPHAEVHNEICLATQLRQQAVVEQAPAADLVVVVGDRRSNNSRRLVQVAQEKAQRPAILIDQADDLTPALLAGVRTVAVTSGSSTPSQITRAVIQALEAISEAPGASSP